MRYSILIVMERSFGDYQRLEDPRKEKVVSNKKKSSSTTHGRGSRVVLPSTTSPTSVYILVEKVNRDEVAGKYARKIQGKKIPRHLLSLLNLDLTRSQKNAMIKDVNRELDLCETILLSHEHSISGDKLLGGLIGARWGRLSTGRGHQLMCFATVWLVCSRDHREEIIKNLIYLCKKRAIADPRLTGYTITISPINGPEEVL